MSRFQAFASLPRLGLVLAPTPLEAAPELALRLAIPSLLLKRDDLLPALHGGTKARKLDILLAEEPFRSAPSWLVSGAVGSGQVAATVAAGRRYDRPVHAHLFRTALSAHGRENLAWTASWATSIHGYRSQVELALRAPRLVLGLPCPVGAVVPIGATSPRAMLGCVLAGIELAEQVASLTARGEPAPDAIYVPWGSGGTAVGLAVGVALAGLDLPVRAVTVVDRLFSPEVRVRRLVRQAEEAVRALGLTPRPLRLELCRSQVGPGYGEATPASIDAAHALIEAGIAGEPAYSGKALAALVQDAISGRTHHPIFWVTVRRPGLEALDGWAARLPASLRDLGHEAAPSGSPTRRNLLLGFAAAAALVGAVRLTGYAGVDGEVLGAAELAVLRAAAETLVPPSQARRAGRAPRPRGPLPPDFSDVAAGGGSCALLRGGAGPAVLRGPPPLHGAPN